MLIALYLIKKGETWQQYHMASPAARKVSDYFSLLQKLQMKK